MVSLGVRTQDRSRGAMRTTEPPPHCQSNILSWRQRLVRVRVIPLLTYTIYVVSSVIFISSQEIPFTSIIDNFKIKTDNDL